jgi:hypothetical protein
VRLNVSSGCRARTDVHLLADVRAIPLNVAHDTRASAVGAGAGDEGRPAQLLIAAEAVAQLALLGAKGREIGDSVAEPHGRTAASHLAMGGSATMITRLARPECVAQPGAGRESAARGRGRELWRHKDGTLTMHALPVALIGRAA